MAGCGLWLAYRMSSFSSLPCARMTRMRLRIWPATALAWASASYRQAGRPQAARTAAVCVRTALAASEAEKVLRDAGPVPGSCGPSSG